jgi:hypothetical protein
MRINPIDVHDSAKPWAVVRPVEVACPGSFTVTRHVNLASAKRTLAVQGGVVAWQGMLYIEPAGQLERTGYTFAIPCNVYSGNEQSSCGPVPVDMARRILGCGLSSCDRVALPVAMLPSPQQAVMLRNLMLVRI